MTLTAALPQQTDRAFRRLATLAVTALVLLLGFGAGTARAHAVLESSTPAQGSIVKTAPAQVRLHFGEPVEISVGSLRVLDGNGKPVQTAAASHPDGVGSDVAVPLKSLLADGTFLVLWRLISADSHPVDGTFTFSVGHAGTVAAGKAATTDKTVAGAIGVARGIGYLGIAVFLGGVAFVLLCWPQGARSRRSRRLTAAGWLVAMVGAAAVLILQGPYGAGLGLADSFNHQVLRGVIDGRYGHAVLVRLVLLVVSGAAAWWVLRRVPPSLGAVALFTISALGMLGTFAYTGHAGVGIQVPLAVISDLTHLTAMSLWLGGLVQLAIAVLPVVDDRTARRAAARFSTVALLSVIFLVISGSYQAWRQAGVLDDLTSTHYGQLLLIKVSLVLVVVCIGYLSRRWVRQHRDRTIVAAHTGDAVSAPADTSTGEPAGSDLAPSGLRLTVALEAALLVVVLAVTSFLVSAPPARGAYRPATAINVQAGPVLVQVSIVPKAARVLEMHFYTFGSNGQVLPVQELDVSMTLPSRQVGPITIPVADIGGSHFLAADVQVPYAGHWVLGLKVRTTAIDEYDATTKVTVR